MANNLPPVIPSYPASQVAQNSSVSVPKADGARVMYVKSMMDKGLISRTEGEARLERERALNQQKAAGVAPPDGERFAQGKAEFKALMEKKGAFNHRYPDGVRVRLNESANREIKYHDGLYAKKREQAARLEAKVAATPSGIEALTTAAAPSAGRRSAGTAQKKNKQRLAESEQNVLAELEKLEASRRSDRIFGELDQLERELESELNLGKENPPEKTPASAPLSKTASNTEEQVLQELELLTDELESELNQANQTRSEAPEKLTKGPGAGKTGPQEAGSSDEQGGDELDKLTDELTKEVNDRKQIQAKKAERLAKREKDEKQVLAELDALAASTGDEGRADGVMPVALQLGRARPAPSPSTSKLGKTSALVQGKEGRAASATSTPKMMTLEEDYLRPHDDVLTARIRVTQIFGAHSEQLKGKKVRVKDATALASELLLALHAGHVAGAKIATQKLIGVLTNTRKREVDRRWLVEQLNSINERLY